MRGLIVGNVKISTKGKRTPSCESGSLRVNPLMLHSGDEYRTVEEARLLDLICISGWAAEYRASPDTARTAAREAIERWVDLGLQFTQGAAGARMFDPAEAINFAKSLGFCGEDEFWEHRYVATGRRLIQDLRDKSVDADGSQRFSLRLERRFNLAHYAAGTNVRLHLPLPIEDASLGDLTVTPLVEDARIEPGRLVASVRVPPERTATVSADIAFRCQRGTAEMPDLQLYLCPNEGLIQTTPRVEKLAQQLGISAREPLESMRSVWNFMFERMTLGVVHYDRVPSDAPLDWTIDTELFDCRLGAALIAALCRTAGIPARLRSGYTLYDIPFYHYWVEVWTDERGWLPFDLICWDLSLRGRDAAWRDTFFGSLDAHMTTEILPRSFTGFPSVQFPQAWHLLARPVERGAAFGVFANGTSALVYEDTLSFNAKAGPLLP
jgi:hypothetical protein